MLVTFLLLCHTAASGPFTTARLNPMSLSSKLDQPQEECPSLGRNRLPTFETPDTGSTADASLLWERAALRSIESHLLFLSKCVHSVHRTRCFDRIACYSVLLLCLMMVRKENASIEVVQSNVRSQHTAPQEVGLASGRASA